MKHLITLITVLFIGSFNSSYAQFEVGTGLADTWITNEDYCTYRHVKVTNTTGKTMNIVIYILKDDGSWRSMGISTIKAGDYKEEKTCTKTSEYRWVVVEEDCYDYKKMLFPEDD